MSGVEAFTIMAILEAKDRISGVLTHVDETLNSFSSTAARAADTARVAGAAIDESFLQTASGADALEVANARLSASQASLAQTTQEQAAAERELLAAQAEAAAVGAPVWEATPEPVRQAVAKGASTIRQRRGPLAVAASALVAGYLAVRWWRRR